MRMKCKAGKVVLLGAAVAAAAWFATRSQEEQDALIAHVCGRISHVRNVAYDAMCAAMNTGVDTQATYEKWDRVCGRRY